MKKALLFCAIGLLLMILLLLGGIPHQGKWAGVDETVVEKFAREANRPPREPWINTDQGDLLLFVFLLAGAAGGFVGGYYFRELFSPGSRKET